MRSYDIYYIPKEINIRNLISKAYNRPNSIKDHLYDNLSFIEKMKLIFKGEGEGEGEGKGINKNNLLNTVFPNFIKNLNILNVIMIIILNISWFVFGLFSGLFNIILGISGMVISMILFVSTITYAMESDFNDDDEMTKPEKICYWIMSILSFTLFIDFIIMFMLLFVFNGQSKIKKYIIDNYENDFCDEFNTIYYDDNYTAYLKHEMIDNVKINNEYNSIYYDYLDDNIDLYRINNNCYVNSDERAIAKYIKQHTNRELNFKQLLLKLSYLEQKSVIDQSQNKLEQDEKDNERIKLIMKNQISEEELMKRQFNK